MAIEVPEKTDAADEAAYLEQQSRSAEDAIRETLGQMPGDMRRAGNVKAWIAQFPWAAVATAGACGLAGAIAARRPSLFRRKPRSSRRAIGLGARPRVAPARSRPKRSILGRALGMATTTVQTSIIAAITSKTQADSQADQEMARYSRTGPTTRQRRESAADSTGLEHLPQSWWGLLKQTYLDWSDDKAPRLGAALAYYTIFSLAPLLVVALAVAGLVFGPEAAKGQLDTELQGFLGKEGAEGVQAMIARANEPAASKWAAGIGLGALLLGASAVFGQLKDALNTIWEVEAKPGGGVVGWLKTRFLSFSMVVVIGFLLLVSLAASAVVSAFGSWFQDDVPGRGLLLQTANIVVSFVVVTFLFALLFRFLPDAKVAWHDVWIGAAVTAVLFTLGKYLIGLYLGRAAVGTTFGAAGSLVIVLLWTYYSAQILFMGAEFTQVYARMYGSRRRSG